MVPLDLVTIALLLGVAVLASALYPIALLLRITNSRSLQRCWSALALLILGFIAGYLALIWTLPHDLAPLLEAIVCAVLFGGSIFVLAVSVLATRTASDVARLVRLEHEVIVDPLTGAYNRRFFDKRLGEEVARAERNGSELSLLVMDLDRFKRVNDTHGHSAGDRVLAVIAATIAAELRPNDILARIGGEEFVVISLLNGAAPVRQMAERLCGTVRSARIQLAGDQQICVSISVGVATLSPGETAQALFDRADRAVFEAKELGRDRIVVAPDFERQAARQPTPRRRIVSRQPSGPAF
ncbi:MAG: GGDEF domain-containing protein [Silicimonas sp.]|jgi:diguanylate cyclase (GGDEF)-like protein|nr:GGDEF domain-containing protein [Silicimonas sp.]